MKTSQIVTAVACAFFAIGCAVGDVDDERRIDSGYVDGKTTTSTDPDDYDIGGAGGGSMDATTTTSTVTGEGGASVTTSTGAPAQCEPKLTIQTVSHSDAEVTSGDQDIEVLRLVLSATECADVEVTNVSIELSTPDADKESKTPFCGEPCSTPADWNFVDLKLKNTNTGAIPAGPTSFHDSTVNQHAVVDFIDPFLLTAGTSVEIAFTLDIAEPLMTQVSGLQYKAFVLGVVTEPYTVQYYENLQDPESFITIQ